MKFSAVGILNTLIDLSVFSVLFYMAHVPVLWAHGCGFCLAVANSFLWNYRWTFRAMTGERWQTIAARFLLVALAILAVTTPALWFLQAVMPVFVAKLAVIALGVLMGYILNLRLVFTDKGGR